MLDCVARRLRRGCCGVLLSARVPGAAGLRCVCVGGTVRCSSARCPPASSPTRTRATSSSPCRARRACRSPRREKVLHAGGGGAARAARGGGHVRRRRLLASGHRPQHRHASSSTLKPWEEREGRSTRWRRWSSGCAGRSSRIGGARVLPFQPPAIRGVGSVGGFQFIVEDTPGTALAGRAGARPRRTLVAQGNEERPAARRLHLLHRATPRCWTWRWIARRPRRWACRMEQIFRTLQLYMGSQYVNDFNYANRTYRVYLQAEQQFRDSPADIGAFYVRSDAGDMIPLEALVKVTPTTTAQIIRHYNLFRSAEINGQARSGRRPPARRWRPWRRWPRRTCPQGMSSEWTGISLEQKESGGQTLVIFALGLLFVFLVLAAQYESFSPARSSSSSRCRWPSWERSGCRCCAGCQRRVLPGGSGDAGGPGQQERHPHRRVRRAAARAGQERGGRGDRRRPRCACGPS